jgi:hypothetical protein
MGASFFREGEAIAPTKEEKRIPAGITWAKIMMIPKVRKKHAPKSPAPLTPPAKAIPKEAKTIDMMKTRLRMSRIFSIFTVIVSFIGDSFLHGHRLSPWNKNFFFNLLLFLERHGGRCSDEAKEENCCGDQL